MSAEKKRIKEQMLVNSAIGAIKKQLNDLEASRQKYIEAAAEARSEGIASQYNLAKNAIRIVTAQRAAVERMLLNLQLSDQIKDMSEMTKTFADGMKLLSGSITETAGGMNFERATKQMTKAMTSTQMKQAESDAFLDATQGAFDGFSAIGGASGSEIDKMIDREAGHGSLDDDIAELERTIKNKLGNTSN